MPLLDFVLLLVNSLDSQMAVRESKAASCLIYCEHDDHLKSLLKQLCDDREIVETELSQNTEASSTAYTCETEIDSKYVYTRLRFIASSRIDALLDEVSIQSIISPHTSDSLSPICSILVTHPDFDAVSQSSREFSAIKSSIELLMSKWTPESGILLGNPHFGTLEKTLGLQQKNDFAMWCVKNQVEMVEMEPDVEDGDLDEEERELEEYGVKRIMSALAVGAAFVHKESSDGPRFQRLSSCSSSSSGDNQQSSGAAESGIANGTEEENDHEQFESLFSRLATMKDRCQAMPDGPERQAYAERVVTAFWKAIGGDEGELGSSSSYSSLSSSSSSLSANDEGREQLVTNED